MPAADRLADLDARLADLETRVAALRAERPPAVEGTSVARLAVVVGDHYFFRNSRDFVHVDRKPTKYGGLGVSTSSFNSDPDAFDNQRHTGMFFQYSAANFLETLPGSLCYAFESSLPGDEQMYYLEFMPPAVAVLFRTQERWPPPYYYFSSNHFFPVTQLKTYPEEIRQLYTNDTIPRVGAMARTSWDLNDEPDAGLYGFGLSYSVTLGADDIDYKRLVVPLSDFVPRFKRGRIGTGGTTGYELGNFDFSDAQEGKVYIWVESGYQIMVFAPGFTEARRVSFTPDVGDPEYSALHGHQLDHDH